MPAPAYGPALVRDEELAYGLVLVLDASQV